MVRTNAGVSCNLYWRYFHNRILRTVAEFLPKAGDAMSSYSLMMMSINVLLLGKLFLSSFFPDPINDDVVPRWVISSIITCAVWAGDV